MFPFPPTAPPTEAQTVYLYLMGDEDAMKRLIYRQTPLNKQLIMPED